MLGNWKIVNVALESNCWLYQTGIKTSNKRYSKGDILYVVFLIPMVFIHLVSTCATCVECEDQGNDTARIRSLMLKCPV